MVQYCKLFLIGAFYYQWRIQDFAEVGAPTLGGGGAKILFLSNFPKKLHEIERIWTPRSATDYNSTAGNVQLC